MTRKTHPQGPFPNFDFDQIQQWGPALEVLFRDALPKNLARIYEAEEVQDMDHAAQVLFAHLKISKSRAMNLLREWLWKRDVVLHFPVRMTPEEALTVKERGFPLCNALHRLDALLRMLRTHPDWRPEHERGIKDLIKDLMPRKMSYRQPWFYLSASKNCLVQCFGLHPGGYEEFDALLAKKLLGPTGVELVRSYGERYVISKRMTGHNACLASQRWAKRRKYGDASFLRCILEAWALWLVDREFSPADECLYIGFESGGGISVKDMLAIERLVAWGGRLMMTGLQ